MFVSVPDVTKNKSLFFSLSEICCWCSDHLKCSVHEDLVKVLARPGHVSWRNYIFQLFSVFWQIVETWTLAGASLENVSLKMLPSRWRTQLTKSSNLDVRPFADQQLTEHHRHVSRNIQHSAGLLAGTRTKRHKHICGTTRKGSKLEKRATKLS